MGAGHSHNPILLTAAPWLAGLDARARLAALLLLALATALSRTPEGAGAGLWAALAVAFWGGVPLAAVLVRLWPLALGLAPLVALSALGAVPGERAVAAWVSEESLLRAATLAMRAVGAAAAVVLALALAPLEETAEALAGLGLPPRAVHATTLAVRYLASVRGELDRMRLALRARAFAPGLDRRTLAVYGATAGSMLLRGFRRTERVDLAMRARGFDGTLRPVRLAEAAPARKPRLGAAVIAALALAVAAIDLATRFGGAPPGLAATAPAAAPEAARGR